MNLKRQGLSLALVSMLSLGAAQAASAAVVLNFQAGLGLTATATNAAGVTTIVGTNVPVTASVENAGNVNAFFDFTFTSTGAAVLNAGQVEQPFSGTFSFNSLANNTGTDYLSGTFSDRASGAQGGAQLTLGAGTPQDTIVFTAGPGGVTSLDLQRALSIAFTGLTSPLAIVGGSINSFQAATAGNFSANIGQTVPEPATLLLFGSALVGIAARFRRRR